MNITFENTRALGIGETVLPDDYFRVYADEDGGLVAVLEAVSQPEVGKIITEDEETEYRRLIGSNPYDAIETELGLETDMGKKALRIFLEVAKLLDEKQKAYGMENVRWLGEYGVNLRVGEKTMRIKNLLDQKYDPQTETIEDSWKDMAALSIIGMMVRRGLWK